jgi:hypothetical protein
MAFQKANHRRAFTILKAMLFLILTDPENYIISIGFPRVKVRNLIGFKIMKAHQ